MKEKKQNKELLSGSQAIAQTIRNIEVDVISVYPITPQTHIIEELAKNEKNKYQYIQAESEFSSASIILGASATGVRTYSTTSSQGLLLMTEVLFNIAGLRLPIVMTCANRGVSAPITIWNDHQDVMTIRDAGWILFFAETHQEAIDQHILAYKIAEKLSLPVMVNMDGFILTHSHESSIIPSSQEIKKFLLKYNPNKNKYLNTKNPITIGYLAGPEHYSQIRKKLHQDLINSQKEIKKQYDKYHQVIFNKKNNSQNNAFVEYYGAKNPDLIFIAMGSVVGTIKAFIDENKDKKLAVLKIKCFRPFPVKEILKYLAKTKKVIIIEKAISLGATDGPLGLEIKAIANMKLKIKNHILGLGGEDITRKMLSKILF